jgi:enoyl-CoA hydratase/carnithine racemase
MALVELQKRMAQKAGDQKVAFVKEGNVAYLVLNDKVNVWDPEKINLIISLLDQIEADEDIALMVTLSTNSKFFSTGFNLNVLMGNREISGPMYVAMQTVFGRILTMNCHTLAITSGHVFAAGFMIALCHDTCIAYGGEDKGRWCMSELNIGLTISEGMADLMKHLMRPSTTRVVMWGGKFTAKEMLKMEIVTGLFT